MPKLSATVAPQAASISERTRLEARAGLARGHDVAQPELARIHARLARPGGEVRGEGERAEDGGDAELRDQLEQAPRLARPHGHDRRAARLEGHVVGDAARVERVVEAVGDHVVRPHAGDPERLAAHGAVRLVVALREAHGHRLARGSRGHVHAHEALAAARTGGGRTAGRAAGPREAPPSS